MSNIVPFQEMESMASYIVRSKLFGAKDESQAMSLMLIAQAEGCHPMTAVQDFDIVQGRPARKTHSILARFQAAGGSVAWEEITPQRACGTFTHKQGGSLRVEWTFADAQKAKLTGKDNWQSYPKAMLRARCIAEGVRAVFPGAIGGLLSVEEAQDISPSYEPAKNMGAAEVMAADTVNVDALIVEVEKTSTDSELMTFWATHNPTLKSQPADYAKLKTAVTAKRQALKKALEENTIDMPVKEVKRPAPVPDALVGLIADMEAAADGGPEAFAESWGSLSKATQASLAAHYDALVARAAAAA